MLDERRDLRSVLEGLEAGDWNRPSLCGEWTVRDLVAHLVAWDDLLIYRSRREHLRALARFSVFYAVSLGRMDRLNRRLQSTVHDPSVDGLMTRFATDDSSDLKWLFDGSNAAAHLAEYVIHHQDIRRPLHAPRDIPQERLVAALDGIVKLPGVRRSSSRMLRKRRWEATDVAWASGAGPVTAESGEVILMTLAGREVDVAN
jgi:uncharacterized protein (TIGR03083 family)